METQAYDGPSPEDQERIDDEIYVTARTILIEVYRTDLARLARTEGTRAGAQLARDVTGIFVRGAQIDAEWATETFASRYGVPATLRALATAIELHDAGMPRPEGPLQGD